MERTVKTLVLLIAALFTLGLLLLVHGCTKERIVESSEIIKDIQYITLPPDTIFVVDTVSSRDTVTVRVTDTITVRDTVETVRCDPNDLLAMAALEYHTDPLVLDFINQEFGINDGWIFYLSAFQVDLVQASPAVYDIYGYIDYWTPDWSSYYPLEFLWRLTYTGGDPGDPRNWQQSDPPAAVAGRQPGIKLVPEDSRTAVKW